MPAMPESPSIAAERAMLQSLSRQCSELHHAMDDNEGLETGVNLMFGVISRCRKISQDHAENLSVPDKLELDEHCQDAMQVVGNMAKKAFASRANPTKDMDMRAMRYTPGISMLPITTSALALRMLAIRQNMCELWSLDANASTVLSTASKVLRLCSGAEFTLHCSNGQALKLDAMDFAHIHARHTKKELFDIVVLTLMCLARSHSVWFNATIPTTEPRRAVMLWNIKIPGTGSEVLAGASGRRNCKSSRVIDNRAMSSHQASYIQVLRSKLTQLRSMSPNSLPCHSKKYLPIETPSMPDTMRLPERADRVVAFVESVIRGRKLERDSFDKTYNDSLFGCAEEALTHLFFAAMTFFGVSELPSATTPSVFRPSLSERPRPIPSDTDGLRSWLIEGALDRAGPLETSISTRVNMTCSVVEYAVGETMISAFSAGVPEMLLLPAVHNKDDAWRRQMLSYVGFAIVAQAQHLSRHFGGRDVKILNKLVFPWKKVVDESVIEKYAEQRVSYSCSAWNKD